jgi:DNA-binding transcriptional LysR family regulator
VSRRIAGLEAQLGERLLLRTTRKLTVTDFGHSVLEHARQVASEVEAAASLAQHRQVEPKGRLRVSMPGDFAAAVLGQMLARFIERYPAISLELDLTPRRVDLIGENFDLALRMGDLGEDTSLTARRIATMSIGLYAAPSYLQRRGMPPEPEAMRGGKASRRGAPPPTPPNCSAGWRAPAQGSRRSTTISRCRTCAAASCCRSWTTGRCRRRRPGRSFRDAA